MLLKFPRICWTSENVAEVPYDLLNFRKCWWSSLGSAELQKMLLKFPRICWTSEKCCWSLRIYWTSEKCCWSLRIYWTSEKCCWSSIGSAELQKMLLKRDIQKEVNCDAGSLVWGVWPRAMGAQTSLLAVCLEIWRIEMLLLLVKILFSHSSHSTA